jgi:23S rRNA (pseudouridine1915-N3)-methyltransferase
MVSINLICVGNLKDKYWKDACNEYEKRLSRWCKFNLIEISENKLSSNPNVAEINSALDDESERILQKIASNSYIYSLCIEGVQMPSIEFANDISKLMVIGYSNIYFIIGSSFGLSDKIKIKANSRLSFSQMTFPHRLARVMLMEQIYRAFCILNNVKYNK